MRELFIVIAAILVVGGVVATIIDFRSTAPADVERRERFWVRLALLVVRVAQGALALLAIALVLLNASGQHVNLQLAESVGIDGNGVVVVLGEPGYMKGICSGEHGPSGAFTTGDLCPDDAKVRQAFGRTAVVDHVVVRKTDRTADRNVWLLECLALVGLAAFAVILGSLGRVLKRAAAGRPFARESVRSLRVIAAAVVVGGTIVPWLGGKVTQSAVEVQLGPESVPLDALGLTLWPCLMALLLLALAEVWRFGIGLQEDAEATV